MCVRVLLKRRRDLQSNFRVSSELCPYIEFVHTTICWPRVIHQPLPIVLSMLVVRFYTVFLSRFDAFLKSEMTFSKLLVQPPHHLVICAHHKSGFSLFSTNCDCFGTFMQSIMHICLRFPTFSVANIMFLKMLYTVICTVVLPLKTSSH